MLTTIIANFKYINFFLDPDFSVQFSRELSQNLMNRLDNVSAWELKELDREVSRRSAANLETFTRMHNPNITTGQIQETYELKIAKQQLKSSYFERRIRGMSDFKEIFKKVNNREIHGDKLCEQKELPFSKYLTFELFSEWLD